MRDRHVSPEAFRALRKARGYTPAQLAERASVSLSYIKYIEAGSTQPSDLYAEALARALDCAVGDFSDPKSAAA